MKFLISPYFEADKNLALEEHLFESTTEDLLVIYRNEDSVIIGKHQNAVNEANSPYLNDHNIPLFRRFSGGGTVFHDLNNINFSFITTGENTKVVDFKRYALPVIYFLQQKGIPALLSERNDIMVDGKKVSGHAAHAKNKRALHHGTLLFNSDLKKLSAALKSNNVEYKSNAVKSVRSKVTNIAEYLTLNEGIEIFIQDLAHSLKSQFKVDSNYILSDKEINTIKELAENKYQSWDWNYGYSPPYVFQMIHEINRLRIDCTVSVKKGRIESFNYSKRHTFSPTFTNLIGVRHCKEDIRVGLNAFLPSDQSKKVIEQMF